jgi:hypothetical protein
MTAILKVDTIQDTAGNNIINESSDTITIGASGDTVTVPGTEVKSNKLSPASGTALQIGDSGDTITIPSGATIANSGTATGFGGGKILQVVSAFHSSQASTTSTSFVDLSSTTNVSITPSATSSKILVLAQWNELFYNGTTSHYLRITRGGTEIMEGHNTYFPSLSGEKLLSANQIFVDSPSTTSATEYKMQFRSQNGTSVVINQNAASGGSGIVLMEIGA